MLELGNISSFPKMPFSVVGSSQKNLMWLYDDLGINYHVLNLRSDVFIT